MVAELGLEVGGTGYEIRVKGKTSKDTFGVFEKLAGEVAKAEPDQRVNATLVLDGPVHGEGATDFQPGECKRFDNLRDKQSVQLHEVKDPDGNVIRNAVEFKTPSEEPKYRGDMLNIGQILRERLLGFGKELGEKLIGKFRIRAMLNDTPAAAKAIAIQESNEGRFSNGQNAMVAIAGTGWNVFKGHDWKDGEFVGNQAGTSEDWQFVDPQREHNVPLEGPMRPGPRVSGDTNAYLAAGDIDDTERGFKATANYLLRTIAANPDDPVLDKALEILKEVDSDLTGTEIFKDSILTKLSDDKENPKLDDRTLIAAARGELDGQTGVPDRLIQRLCWHMARRQAERMKEIAGDMPVHMYVLNGGFAKALYSVPGTQETFLNVVNEGSESDARLVVDDLEFQGIPILQKHFIENDQEPESIAA